MEKFIDAEEALRMMKNSRQDCPYTTTEKLIWNLAHDSCISCIMATETADVVEVKRGHWIEDEVCVYACSECGFTFTSADDISEFKYCRCGAKMDGR